ncbi:MAG: SDR family NAD(P)-dependent oxidoreductase [Streptosporangiaceae bacterium]
MQAYRTALVTGASSGIGESLARHLAARGCDLVVVARRTDRLESLAEELRRRHGRAVEVLTADLTDDDQLRPVEERLGDPRRPIELLANNAGFGSAGRFARLSIEREDRQVRLNVLALMRLTHAALPAMIERRHGGVLNVSSLAGLLPSPGNATYAASKAFVTTFSESIHGEVKRDGVHVTALCAGFTRTEFQGSSGIGEGGLPEIAWLDRDDVARAGLDAVMAGRAVCVPGTRYKPVPVTARLMPRGLLREIVARVWQ